MLGDLELNKEWINGLDTHQVRPWSDIIPNGYQTETQHTVKGGANGGFFQLCLGQISLCLRHSQLAGNLVTGLGTDKALLAELTRAGVLALFYLQVGLCLVVFGPQQTIVNL